MKLTLIAIYGSIGYLCSGIDGEKHTIKTPVTTDLKPLTGLNYITSGCIVLKNKRTQDVVEIYKTGSVFDNTNMVNLDTSSLLEYEFTGDTEWLCILDKNVTVKENFVMKDKEERTIPMGTNLFLLKGKLTIKSMTFNGPTPIRVKTSDVIMKSIDNSNVLIVT